LISGDRDGRAAWAAAHRAGRPVVEPPPDPAVAQLAVFMPIAVAPMHGPESASRVGSSRGPIAIT